MAHRILLKMLISLIFIALINIFNPAHAEGVRPVVYTYWAGWSNKAIPDTNIDGLLLSFAQMRGGNNNYYTDYSASANFQQPAQTGAYPLWNNWLVKHWNSGGRAYVSYGGGTNDDFRGYIMNGSDTQLAAIAGEIKANIKKYYFDGVELDVENWWGYGASDNQRFAAHFATLVKILRQSLDNDPGTAGKPIIIAVGWEAAGTVTDMGGSNSQYAGTMKPFFADKDAVNAIRAVNIMSYNTGISEFYSKLNLVDNILNTFVNAGVPKEKLIFGVQPCEKFGNKPATSINTIVSLGQHIAANQFGGLFMWGIGTAGMCDQDPNAYLTAMKTGLGIN